MSNLRTRILGLATMATAFVGMSFGQSVVCNSGTNVLPGATAQPGTVANLGVQINPSLRAESQTEMLAVYQFNCSVVVVGGTSAAPTYTAPAPAAAGQNNGTSGTIYVNTNLPITSKQVSASTNEATVIINGSTTTVGANGQIVLGNGIAVSGTVNGTQVTFTLPACVAATNTSAGSCPIPDYPASAEVEVTNIRVNASSAGSPQTTESGLLSYVVPNTTGGLITANLGLPAANAPGYILKSLGAPTVTVSSNSPYYTCVGNPGNNLSFTVNINQLIPDAFLGVGTTTSLLPGSEVGQYISGGIGSANADIINVTLSNLPASATVYVPQTTATYGTGGNTVTLTIAGSTVSTATGAPAGSVAYTPSGGSVTIPYTVVVAGIGDQTTQSGANAIQVPVYVGFAANSAAAQGPITANYSYAPAVASLTAPPTVVPQFVASSFTAANGATIVNCQTTLLFPFVTNQSGYDTGIALANTSTDNLGTSFKSLAASQSGTCTLFFYGSSAPSGSGTPANSVADPMGSLAAGQTHAFQLSSIAAGYQGYMIVNCPFVYGRGYAFLFEGSGATSVAQGYLPEILDSRAATSTTTIGDTTQY